jgi:hypothetical protein
MVRRRWEVVLLSNRLRELWDATDAAAIAAKQGEAAAALRALDKAAR